MLKLWNCQQNIWIVFVVKAQIRHKYDKMKLYRTPLIFLLGIQCELLPGNSNHGTRESEQGHQEPTIFNNQPLVPGLAGPTLIGETAFPGLQTTLDITARTNETVFPDMFKNEQTQHLAGNTRTNIKVRRDLRYCTVPYLPNHAQISQNGLDC